mgnify:CR=1 FL=1
MRAVVPARSLSLARSQPSTAPATPWLHSMSSATPTLKRLASSDTRSELRARTTRATALLLSAVASPAAVCVWLVGTVCCAACAPARVCGCATGERNAALREHHEMVQLCTVLLMDILA